MGNIIRVLLEIYFSFQQWKNFENPLKIHKVIAMSLVYYFFVTQCRLHEITVLWIFHPQISLTQHLKTRINPYSWPYPTYRRWEYLPSPPLRTVRQCNNWCNTNYLQVTQSNTISRRFSKSTTQSWQEDRILLLFVLLQELSYRKQIARQLRT